MVFFCPKNPKHYIAVIADTFLGIAGVRYRQVWLYISEDLTYALKKF